MGMTYCLRAGGGGEGGDGGGGGAGELHALQANKLSMWREKPVPYTRLLLTQHGQSASCTSSQCLA
jgi:hypothetical protein